MKEKWKVLERHLSREYGIEVQASYEGWGAGYDPAFLPLTEMWAKGEVEEIPSQAKRPVGLVFYLQELSKKTEEGAISTIRHEIEYLLNTDLYLWRLGQREFYKFGFTPTSFLVLYALLECIKVDYRITQKHPLSEKSLKERYKELLKTLEIFYPHHLFALGFLKGWLGKETMEKDRERILHQYLKASNREAYDVLMEELLGKYMAHIERSQELNYIDLLIDEAKGRVRKDAHRGRIMTDLLRKMPPQVQAIITRYKDQRSVDIPEEERKEILKSLKNVPDWMKDYLKQMSYLSLVEKDIEFIKEFLPKTLEIDIEHRGFLSFLIKPWEEQPSQPFSSLWTGKSSNLEEDLLYEKAYGLGKEEFKLYRRLVSSVLPYVETLKRKLKLLMPAEEEKWSGKHFFGKKLDNKILGLEVAIGRGRLYMRREEAVRKEIAFKLLIDISTSMKKEDKIKRAVEALLLFSEVIHTLKMPFSIDVFSDKVFRLKSFQEDYKAVKCRVLSLFDCLGGGTNLEKGLLYAFEDLQVFSQKNHIKGCLIVFSDGEPTKGLKGKELKDLINQIKLNFPTIGIGVGTERNYVDYYFENTGIKIKDIAELNLAFIRIIENQARRLLSFQ